MTVFPTVYLIGNDGKPLEVIVGNVAEEEFFSKIKIATEVNLIFFKWRKYFFEIKIFKFHNSKKQPVQHVKSEDVVAASTSSASTSNEQIVEPNTNTEQSKSLDERVAL